jgi:asparagine synthetase B (glutamine-hydrolysing)
MCGIVGLVTAPRHMGCLSDSEKVIEQGLSAIKVRGPDSRGMSGSECGNFQVNLGHTRLSIMDLAEAGAQLMEDGRYVLSYNGEIYNFVEIREELKKLGYIFIGNSDTEVLFKSWVEWGVNTGERSLNLTASPVNLWGKSDITFSERQVEDIRKWSIPSLLRFEDRNSMSFGVESRLPFMDYRLIEFGLLLPAKLKIKNGYGKWILRDAIKNYVPDAIRLNRMKRGFDVTQTWLRDGLALGIRETLLDNRSLLKDYFLDGIDLEKILTEQNLTNNPLLLDEAIMLFWQVNIKRA